MTSNKVRVLGLDLSLTSTGYSVIEITDGETVTILNKGTIKTNSKQFMGDRLRAIVKEISRVRQVYKPDYEVREKSFSNSRIMATQQLFKLNGAYDMSLSLDGIHVDTPTIAPTSVKRIVGGNGKASKEEVLEGVKHYVGDIVFGTLDESDSVAVAIAYAIDKGLLI